MACASAGISPDSFSRYLDAFADFAAEIQQARGKSALIALSRIDNMAKEGSFAAARWQIERLFPADYSPKSGVQINIPSAPQADDDDEESTVPAAGVTINITAPFGVGERIRNDPDALESIDALLLARGSSKKQPSGHGGSLQ